MVVISHDPHARVNTTRGTVHTNDTCTFCGGKNTKGRLFRYGSIADDKPSQHNQDTKLFCSLVCRNSYYQY